MLYRIIFTFLIILMSESSFGQWYQVGARIDGEAAGDWAGSDVSLNADGSIMAVSSINNNNGAASAGHVRIYEFDGTDWIQLGSSLQGQDILESFGRRAKLSDDGYTVAISAPGTNSIEPMVGSVQVYTFNGTNWVQVGDDILGVQSHEKVGSSLSISSDGNTIAIGTVQNNGVLGNSTGRVDVYTYNGTSWIQVGASLYGENVGDLFGGSISLNDNGTILAVGAVEHDNNVMATGQVKVYEFNGTNWVQIGNELNGANQSDRFGRVVCLSNSGDTLAVSSVDVDFGTTGTGGVYVYRRNGSQWEQIGNTIGHANDVALGRSLSLSGQGNVLIAGVAFKVDNNERKGHSRVFQLNGSLWEQVGDIIEGVDSLDYSGWSVDISKNGNTVAIGAITDDDNGEDAGSVHVFNASNFTTSANFGIAVIDTCNGIFEFTDSSTNNPVSWYWDFGDGDTSTLQNPTHQYTSNGVFDVKLIVENTFGLDSITQSIESHIIEGEIGISSPLSIGGPIEFEFIGSDVINFHWNFGDGDTSILESPSHTYLNALEYHVVLNVKNTMGCNAVIDTMVDLTPFLGINVTSSDFYITPNPSSGYIKLINNALKNIEHISVYNALGKSIYNQHNIGEEKNITLNLSEISSGLYTVHVKYKDGKQQTEKIVIKH